MEENIMCELIQGKELTKQLHEQFFSTSSHVENKVLIDKIILSFEKALTKVNVGEIKAKNVNMMDSNCLNESPKSEVQDSEFKHKHVSKKRKTMPKWTEQVKVCLGSTHEGSMQDGYSWRKYGQKDIHGFKFPRGYYRCTHRNVQGCLATKQVQKSNEDPMIHEITYKGRHTCTQSSHFNKKCEFGQNKSQAHKKIQPQEEKLQAPQEKKLSFDNKEDIFPSFNFPSQSIGTKNEGNNIFLETMIENNFMENEDNNIFSESNMFCLSLLDLDNIGPDPRDIIEIISGPNSIANSPIDFDVFNDINFDIDFSINTQ